jgi:adenosine kinase
MAYDNIMVFQGRFKEHILPDQIHILNVAFLVPELRREFGGCAGNIAYNLKGLGGEPVIMATMGEDHPPYSARLEKLGIERTHVREVKGTLTAQAFITTDLDDNQITAFHPGAMADSALNEVPATRRHGAARAATRRRRHPFHFRSGPGPADVQRPRAHGFRGTGHICRGQ